MCLADIADSLHSRGSLNLGARAETAFVAERLEEARVNAGLVWRVRSGYWVVHCGEVVVDTRVEVGIHTSRLGKWVGYGY